MAAPAADQLRHRLDLAQVRRDARAPDCARPGGMACRCGDRRTAAPPSAIDINHGWFPANVKAASQLVRQGIADVRRGAHAAAAAALPDD